MADLVYSVYAIWFSCSQRLLNYLAFKYIGLERTWWRLFQKCVVRTKDIYVFIIPECRHAHETGYLDCYYSRNASCPRNRIFTFLLFQNLVMPTKQDIWFLLFQKRVMPTKQDIYVFVIPETRHAHETGYLRFCYSRNASCPRNKIFTFLLFQKRVMPTKQDIYVFVIPETRHAHETGYLRFYWNLYSLS